MDINGLLYEFISQLSHRSPVIDAAGVFLAEYLIYFIAIGFVYFLFVQRSIIRRLTIFGFTSLSILIGWGIIARFFRLVLDIPRPFAALGIEPLINTIQSPSFPSQHAVFLFALATSVYFFNKQWGWWLFILALLVSTGRVFAGVHWPLDIIGGALVGIFGGIITRLLTRNFLVLNTTEYS